MVKVIGDTKLADVTTADPKTLEDVSHTGSYDVIATDTKGIKKIVNVSGGTYHETGEYLVKLNYGLVPTYDKKLQKMVQKEKRTSKVAHSWTEAKTLLRDAESVRSGERKYTPAGITFDIVVNDFMESQFFKELSDNYRSHYKNYIRHFCDYFCGMEISKITKNTIEQYYDFQMNSGKRCKNTLTKEGMINRKLLPVDGKGISVNTIKKHKTALVAIWDYMINEGIYGVSTNVPSMTVTPLVTIKVGNKKKKVRYIPPTKTILTMEQLNIMINDALENEFDRSIAVMIALASIGGLRRSEIAGLSIGKFFHDNRMLLEPETFEISGYDIEYYKKQSKLMMIDTAYIDVGNGNAYDIKLPKNEKIRVSAIPQCLMDIVEYAFEQRKEVMKMRDGKICSTDEVYVPLINLIKGKGCGPQKLNKVFKQYQARMNKRLTKAGMQNIPEVNLHDLRHTHITLASMDVAGVEISLNVGHKVKFDGIQPNTTTIHYLHDYQPKRKRVIEFWEENIIIDWSKAMNISINNGKQVRINRSGHLVFESETEEIFRRYGRKKYLTEEEEIMLIAGSYNPEEN